MTDTDTVVIEETDALDTAYDMGYDEFSPVPEAGSEEPVDLSFFTESARYANVIAPKLRATAGLEDTGGHGTYQGDREVTVIPFGHEDDKPAPAHQMSARDFYTECVHKEWRRGAYDALKGRDRYASVDRESRIDS